MQNTNIKKYLKLQGLSVSKAAQEIGVSRQTLYEAIRGRPLGKRTALRMEEWSEGFFSAVDLAGLNGRKK